MRRLTLILSDLYLPAGAVRESFPATLELPALQWLLRFARPPRRIDDWRSWLARELGMRTIADWPVAHVHALAAGVDPAGTWLATPVRLEARLDHVRLADRGILRLPSAQAIELAREFQASFGPETLEVSDRQPALLLKRGPVSGPRTTDPARLLDTDVGSALPQGAGAGELRRLSAEIEMWLTGTRTNAARERAGLQKITALWLWGGGELIARDSLSLDAGGTHQLFGGDSFVASLAILASRESLRPVPESFAVLDEHADAYAVFSPMSGPPGESLPAFEANWCAPIRDALSAGNLECCRVVANDRVYEVAARAGWKFWRRRRGWLESLA
jgi:hypothetical protein